MKINYNYNKIVNLGNINTITRSIISPLLDNSHITKCFHYRNSIKPKNMYYTYTITKKSFFSIRPKLDCFVNLLNNSLNIFNINSDNIQKSIQNKMYSNPAYDLGSYNKDFQPPKDILTTEKIDEFEKFRIKHNMNLVRNNKTKLVITHSFTFHADEVLAVTLVKYIKEFNDDYVLVRTRNKEIWNYADIIVDVGGIIDPETRRYDHHMSFFNENFDKDFSDVKLSAAGLVYKYHGKEIIKNITTAWRNQVKKEGEEIIDIDDDMLSDKNIEIIYNKLYKDFIHYVDAQDTGVSQYPSKDSVGNPIEKKYTNGTSYGHRVSRLNHTKLDKNTTESKQFAKAMLIAEDEFISSLSYLVIDYLPAYKAVLEAVNNRLEVHKSGKVILLKNQLPWKEHIINIEKELKIENTLKFAIGSTLKEGHRIFTIPVSQGSFEFRLGLKKEWRGKVDAELNELIGINDAIFVHNSGFIGGAKSYESAIKMVDLSLKEEEN